MSHQFHPAVSSWRIPDDRPIRLKVTNSAAATLHRGDPWLYQEKVLETGREGRPGELAVVYDNRRAFVAIGLYDPTSPIRMRALRMRRPGPIDQAFFAERIDAALTRRTGMITPETDGVRLINGESDGFSGLVFDRYADTGVFKIYSPAWLPWLRTIADLLFERQPLIRIVLRLSRSVQQQGELLHGFSDGDILAGAPLPADHLVVMRENGLLIEVDPVRGQKTGFFLDQRDNRARVERLAKGKTVLNVCSYNGGFSLAAARGGATRVVSLDFSSYALESACRNFALNASDPAIAACRHVTLEGDAFALLADLAGRNERFDLIILDPPSFAVRRAQVPDALNAYARLSKLGLGVLSPKGIIVLASCSNPVSPEQFRDTVTQAAKEAGRPLQIIEETGHAPDHPTDFAENRYLKCIFARA